MTERSEKKNTFVLWADHPGRDNVKCNMQSFLGRLCEGEAIHKSYRVTIEPYVEPRSEKQRNSLFGVAYKAIMEFCGYQGEREKHELHRNLCGEYFGWRDDPMRGRIPVRTTTTDEDGKRADISVTDALEMYAFIQRFAAEKIGCYVPDPDPFWREKARREAA